MKPQVHMVQDHCMCSFHTAHFNAGVMSILTILVLCRWHWMTQQMLHHSYTCCTKISPIFSLSAFDFQFILFTGCSSGNTGLLFGQLKGSLVSYVGLVIRTSRGGTRARTTLLVTLGKSLFFDCLVH
jgi:hypothetical protein